ncbi:MAG TPA: prolyl oligopeptidase family serine peptidase [Kofleriaceae bacterium]|nr:prolyl oligopeptidase family serine peptidase [Kofleriaceae bacterium]
MAPIRWIALAAIVGACHATPVKSAGATSEALPPGARATATRELAGGVTVREVELARAGTPMTVWIYRPAPSATGPRPVVLIAPDGSPLVWGMTLSDGDRAEHAPWAARGYVVVAYSLDGPVADHEDVGAIEVGVRAFIGAHAGLANARAAIDLALACEPRADPDRVYAVGHGSAATLALRVGAELPRVKAIVAFNPVTDVDAYLMPFLDPIRRMDPLAQARLHESSPLTHVAALRTKPVFLFHTTEDAVVPVAESERLAEQLKPAARATQVLIVPTGDHYHSMIEQGVPAAMTWLDAVTGIAAR